MKASELSSSSIFNIATENPLQIIIAKTVLRMASNLLRLLLVSLSFGNFQSTVENNFH